MFLRTSDQGANVLKQNQCSLKGTEQLQSKTDLSAVRDSTGRGDFFKFMDFYEKAVV